MIKIASLFCGCGGSDLGLVGGFTYLGKNYKKNDAEIVYAVDNDPKAIATYNANFKHKALVKDVRDISTREVPDFDLIVGGFPCQSFSTVNPTKNPFDDRAQLYKDMAKIVGEKQPKAFIAENVKGLARLQKGKLLEAVIKEFEKQGYVVSHTIANAADYGVPQLRERVFIVGIRKDIKQKFEFPKPIYYSESNLLDKQWVPLDRVIDDIAGVDKKYYFSKKAVEGMIRAKNNMKRGLAQDLSKPCLTITAHLAKVSLNSRDPVLMVDSSKKIYRRFTPLEAARIQSFPDTFKFVGSEGDAYRQIGNAIAPLMMWHVTNAIIRTLQKANKNKDDRHIHQGKKKSHNVADKKQEHFARIVGLQYS